MTKFETEATERARIFGQLMGFVLTGIYGAELAVKAGAFLQKAGHDMEMGIKRGENEDAAIRKLALALEVVLTDATTRSKPEASRSDVH